MGRVFTKIGVGVVVSLGVSMAQASTLPAGAGSLEAASAGVSAPANSGQSSFTTASAELSVPSIAEEAGLQITPPSTAFGTQSFTWFDWNVSDDNGHFPTLCQGPAPFQPTISPNPPSVPLPAGGLLLLTALTGLGFMRRKNNA